MLFWAAIADTTSRINGFGKDRLLNINDPELWKFIDVFMEPAQIRDTIRVCGQKILLNCIRLKKKRL